jgi:hypothetical protein
VNSTLCLLISGYTYGIGISFLSHVHGEHREF